MPAARNFFRAPAPPKFTLKTGKTTKLGKALDAEPNDLSSSWETHMVKGENQLEICLKTSMYAQVNTN